MIHDSIVYLMLVYLILVCLLLSNVAEKVLESEAVSMLVLEVDSEMNSATIKELEILMLYNIAESLLFRYFQLT